MGWRSHWRFCLIVIKIINFLFYEGKDGVYQNILKKVDLPIVSRNKCLSELRKSYLGQLYELSDSFICAGGELGKDTCKVSL